MKDFHDNLRVISEDIQELVYNKSYGDKFFDPTEYLGYLSHYITTELATLRLHNRLKQDVFEIFNENSTEKLRLLNECKVVSYETIKTPQQYNIEATIKIWHNHSSTVLTFDKDADSKGSILNKKRKLSISRDIDTNSSTNTFTDSSGAPTRETKTPVYLVFSYHEDEFSDVGSHGTFVQTNFTNITKMDINDSVNKHRKIIRASISLRESVNVDLINDPVQPLLDFIMLTSSHTPSTSRVNIDRIDTPVDFSSCTGSDFYKVDINGCALDYLRRKVDFPIDPSDAECLEDNSCVDVDEDSVDSFNDDSDSDNCYNNNEDEGGNIVVPQYVHTMENVLMFILSFPCLDEAWLIHEMVLVSSNLIYDVLFLNFRFY